MKKKKYFNQSNARASCPERWWNLYAYTLLTNERDKAFKNLIQAGLALRGRLDKMTPDILLNRYYSIIFINKSSQKEGKGNNFLLCQKSP